MPAPTASFAPPSHVFPRSAPVAAPQPAPVSAGSGAPAWAIGGIQFRSDERWPLSGLIRFQQPGSDLWAAGSHRTASGTAVPSQRRRVGLRTIRGMGLRHRRQLLPGNDQYGRYRMPDGDVCIGTLCGSVGGAASTAALRPIILCELLRHGTELPQLSALNSSATRNSGA
jgi:hypothetical protein